MASTHTISAFNLCWNILVRESELYNNSFFSEKHLKMIDTRDTDFNIVENRLAYTYKFGCYNILFTEECISKFLSECSTADSMFPFENLNVCSLSNGPGLDIVGLLCALCKSNKPLKGFPQLTAVNLYSSWLHLFKTIVQSAYEVASLKSFIDYFHIPARNIELIQGDVYSALLPGVRNAIEEANVLLMTKVFASTKANSDVFSQTLKEIFSLIKPGSLIFFIGTKKNMKQFSNKSHLSQYVKCIYGPQKVTVKDIPIDEHIADAIGSRPQVSGFAYFIVWQKRDALVDVKDIKRKRRRKKKKASENVVVEKDAAAFVVEDKDYESDAGSEISFSSGSKVSDSFSDEIKSDTNSSKSTSASFKVMKVSSLKQKETFSDGVAYSVDISSPMSRTGCKDSMYEPKEDELLKNTQEKEFEIDFTGMLSLAHPNFENFYGTNFMARKKLNDELNKKLQDMSDEEAKKVDVINDDIAKKSENITLIESSFFNSTDPEKSAITSVEKGETDSFFSAAKLDKSVVTSVKNEETNSFYNSVNLDESDLLVDINLQVPAVNQHFEKAENSISEDVETIKKEETHPNCLQHSYDFCQKEPEYMQSQQNAMREHINIMRDYETSHEIPDEIKENQREKQNITGTENARVFHSIDLNKSTPDCSTDCKSEKLKNSLENRFHFSCDNILGVVNHLQEKKEDKISQLNNYACSFPKECDDTHNVCNEKSIYNQPQIKNEGIFGENDLGFSQMSINVACDIPKTIRMENPKPGDARNEIQDPDITKLVHNFYEDIYETNFPGGKNPANRDPPEKEKCIQEKKIDLNFLKVNSVSKVLQSQTNAASTQNFGFETCEDTCNKNSEKNKFQFEVQTKCPPPGKKSKSKKENAKNQEELKLLKSGTPTNQLSRKLLKQSEETIQTAQDACKPNINLFLQRCENLITSLEKLTDDIKSGISSASNGTSKCCSAKQKCGTSQGSSSVSGINNCTSEKACSCHKAQNHCISCSGTCKNNLILGSRLTTERASPYIVIPLQNEDIIQILTSKTSSA